MKYQLKDRELQAKIEAIYLYFGELLSKSVRNGYTTTSMIILPCEGIEITLNISNSAIEEVHEFDPKAWNVWPEVLPPKKGYYRVEYVEDNFAKKAAWMWDGRGWQIKPGAYFLLDSANEEGLQFKPWDDEEEE